MATTKTRSTTSRAKTTARSGTRSVASRKTPSVNTDGIVARTGRTIKNQPYTSAAIATGAVTAVAAAAAGAFFFSRREKTLKQTAGEVGEKMSDIGDRLVDGFNEAKDKASGLFRKDMTQREIAEEAMSLKQNGDALDELSRSEIKTGAVAY